MFNGKVIHHAICDLRVPSCSTNLINGNKCLNLNFKLLQSADKFEGSLENKFCVMLCQCESIGYK